MRNSCSTSVVRRPVRVSWGLMLGIALVPGRVNAQPVDCNNNGIPDQFDIAFGQSHDLNNNGVPDECDIGVTFDQLNWSDGQGGYVAAFSEWGRAELTFDQTDLPLLFPHPNGGFFGWVNLVTHTPGSAGPNWAVQNLLVHFEGNENFDQALPTGVWFDLSLPRGTPVNTLDYLIFISPQPLLQPPFGPIRFGVPVGQADILFGGVSAPDENPPAGGATNGAPPPPAKNFKGAPAGTASTDKPAKITTPEDQIPAVDEDVNGCGPGSIARSLRYLDATSDSIALNGTAQDDYNKLKDAGHMGTSVGADGTGTSTDDIVSGKKKYVNDKQHEKRIKGNIITSEKAPAEIGKVAEALAGGADVEIIIDWGKNNENSTKTTRHIAFVSDIKQKFDANGDLIGYDVTVLDDVQGDGKAENKRTVHSFDKDGKLLSGSGIGARAVEFIVETLKPLGKVDDKQKK